MLNKLNMLTTNHYRPIHCFISDIGPVFGSDFLGDKTDKMASSNTFLSPFCVKAEHST